MIPTVSVLIPAYNAEKTILAAVWSALNQDFERFEVLVYDDGSTDKTREILEGVVDTRLHVLSGQTNNGIVHARNALLQESKAPFIAWLDADDIMLPGRLQAQYEYLQNRTGIDLVGGWAELRSGGLKDILMPGFSLVKMSNNPDYLSASLCFRNPFIHSSIMARNFFARENLLFDVAFDGFAEDYDLFLRCHNAGKRFGVIPTTVVSYWLSTKLEQSEKEKRHRAQEKWEQLLCRTFPKTPADKAAAIVAFLRNNNRVSADLFAFLADWLEESKLVVWKNPNTPCLGEKAVLLYQKFRLMRLRYGWISALMWLATNNPAVVFCMLRNRKRVL